MKKKIVQLITLFFCIFCAIGETEKDYYSYELEKIEGTAESFSQVWSYVLEGYENTFNDSFPITDLCYFSADVNCYGKLESIPNPSKFSSLDCRKHLVITCSSYSLTHFILKKSSERKELLEEIKKASLLYDGVQIDFETIPKNDREQFHSFLKDVRTKIGKNKIFSVCVPARMKTLQNDIFDYETISSLADYIFIMAYDQHWSTSISGPVAGLDWCKKISSYAVNVIPQEKLVMGLPFYGRSWQDNSYGKAWLNSGINRIVRENKAKVKREDTIGCFEFEAKVKVKGYFDDAYSLIEKMRSYKNDNIDKIGFWRIGQEDPGIWEWIEIKK